MRRLQSNKAEQFGFDELLSDAEDANRQRRFERETGHLPDTMEEGLPFYRALLDEHHEAMLRADVEEAMRLREEARRLALRLNGGEPGILAGDDSAGCVLERETAAIPGTVPLWGQTGEFVIAAAGMRVRIELDGIFGVCGSVCYWPCFAARAVDLAKHFLSPTGYRSFLGIHADPVPGLTPEVFVRNTVTAYVGDALKGKLVEIEPWYRGEDTA